MRKAPTPCEKLLWHELRSLRHRGFIFRRQHVMGRFILDFYCHEARLGIEIDGSSHDSIHRQRDDADRSVFLEEMRGIHLLRFTNQEILADLPSVLDRIQQAAASTQPADAPWYSALLTVELPPELLPFVVFKGSITLDGVALTVAKLEQKMCTIALIPHTLAVTTLGELQEGSVLNVETDVLGRYVAAMLHRSSPVHHEA